MTLYSELPGEGESDRRRLVHLERDQTRPSLPCATRNALTRSAPVWWCSPSPRHAMRSSPPSAACSCPRSGASGWCPKSEPAGC